jgi:predicted pyridoxine 5'-phosphate oxidase superfamily flavin-nucleotide-binding protein
MPRKFLEVAVTPSVLRAQQEAYGRMHPVTGAAERDPLGPREAQFIAARDSFYMATVGESGWPYVQHRGGARGFLRVLGPSTLAFADYGGNRQLLSTGNLAHDDRVALFLMDYRNQRRLKLLGHARVESAAENAALVEQLADPEMRPLVERVIVIDVIAFDWNCPQHITPRYTADEVRDLVGHLTHRIAELERALGSRPVDAERQPAAETPRASTANSTVDDPPAEYDRESPDEER